MRDSLVVKSRKLDGEQILLFQCIYRTFYFRGEIPDEPFESFDKFLITIHHNKTTTINRMIAYLLKSLLIEWLPNLKDVIEGYSIMALVEITRGLKIVTRLLLYRTDHLSKSNDHWLHPHDHKEHVDDLFDMDIQDKKLLEAEMKKKDEASDYSETRTRTGYKFKSLVENTKETMIWIVESQSILKDLYPNYKITNIVSIIKFIKAKTQKKLSEMNSENLIEFWKKFTIPKPKPVESITPPIQIEPNPISKPLPVQKPVETPKTPRESPPPKRIREESIVDESPPPKRIKDTDVQKPVKEVPAPKPAPAPKPVKKSTPIIAPIVSRPEPRKTSVPLTKNPAQSKKVVQPPAKRAREETPSDSETDIDSDERKNIDYKYWKEKYLVWRKKHDVLLEKYVALKKSIVIE